MSKSFSFENNDDIYNMDSEQVQLAQAPSAPATTTAVPVIDVETNLLLDDAGIAGEEFIIIDGTEVPLSILQGDVVEIEPEAGPTITTGTLSGGGSAQPFDLGSIGPNIGVTDLLPYTELSFPITEEEELTPFIDDSNSIPNVVAIPDTPADPMTVTPPVITPVDTTADETGLTDPLNNDEITTGTIDIDTGTDALDSVVIDGVDVTNGGTVIGEYGTLTVTVTPAGEYDFTYELTDNTIDHADPTSTGTNEGVVDDFTIVVTDEDGDTASDSLVIGIIDDGPEALADIADQVGEDTPVSVDVLEDNGAGIDIPGADGLDPTMGVELVEDSLTGTGSLEENPDGTYTYTPGPAEEGSVTFEYVITDGDGDTSTATVTINLNDDSEPVIDVVVDDPGTEPNIATVDEAALDEGSDATSDAETTTGVFNIDTGGDDLTSLVIGGVVVTNGGTVTTDIGVLTVTETNGEYTWSYTLTDPTQGDATSEVFTIEVTDSDDSMTSDTLTINIIDDVPDAIDDTVDQLGENDSITVNVLDPNPDDADVPGADGISTVVLVPGTLTSSDPDDLIGTLTDNGDGTFEYEPAPGEQGIVTFQYEITDGDGDTDTATVTINLNDDSDPEVDVLANVASLGTGDASVDEAALDNVGSDPTSNLETAEGDFNIDTGGDDLASLIIGGVDVTNGGMVIGTNGTLTVTETDGEYSWEYELTDPSMGDDTTDEFTVVVTDSDGDMADDTLTIDIIDDVPAAVTDTDNLGAGEYGPVEGNVITDAEANGDNGADTPGADGASITGVEAGDTNTVIDDDTGVGGAGVQGAYGVLTLGDDGSYSYTRDAETPGDVSDVFTYTLTDGDGDSVTTTLIIDIADGGPMIADLTPANEGGDVIVNEANLDDGSSPDDGALTQGGTFTVTSDDGIASLTVGGETVITDGVFTAVDVVTPEGTLHITGYDPDTGEITYTYELTDNETHADADSTNSVFEEFDVVLTDQDGDEATDTLVVNIIDDVPDAVNDVDSVTEDGMLVASGNVVTSNDTEGADGAEITALDFDGNSQTLGADFAADYGTLNVAADGTYTYTLDNTNADVQGLTVGETLTETVTYTLTDADGDADTATLTITINGANDGVTINGLNVTDGELTLDEDDLPDGSDATPESLTDGGSFSFDAADGTDDVTLGTTDLIVDGAFVGGTPTVTTPTGLVTITGFTPETAPDGSLIGGTFTYTYELQNNTLDHGPADNDENSITDSLTLTVTDTDGSTASDTLDINVIDDVPSAVADTDEVAAGTYGPVAGNVITDAEANGDNGTDTPGADGASVTGVAAGDTNTIITDDTGVGSDVQGTYGVLTLNDDGSYSYTRDPGTEGGVDDIFTYTLTDGDGDSVTTTLTVTIADSGVTIDIPEVEEPGTIVDEAGLPIRTNESEGSMEGLDSETTAGTISFTAADGPGVVSIDGVNVTSVGQTFSGTHGTLTITAINNGSVEYSYTLEDNTSGDATQDDFAVAITDQDGDTTGGTLSIAIIDDVPTSAPDTDVTVSGGTETGNVITDADPGDVGDIDMGTDTPGADGITVTGVAVGDTGTDVSGNVGATINGAYGTLTLNDDGSYTYDANNNALGEDVFTYTVTDGDGDTATTTLTITVNDGTPVAAPEVAEVNEAALDTVEDAGDLAASTITGSLGTTSSDESTSDSVSFTDPNGDTVTVTGAAAGDSGGTDIAGSVGTEIMGTFGLFQINADGTYTYTLTTNSTGHTSQGTGSDGIVDVFSYTVTDSDGNTDTETITINILDDVPSVIEDTAALTPILTTDDTDIADPSSDSGFFSSLFTTVFGADGPNATNATVYSLDISAAGADSGLIDTLSGESIVLNISGDVITGTTSVGGLEVFNISLNASTGEITLTQSRAVQHNDPADPAETGLSTAMLDAGLISLTATVTDGDGDTDSAVVDISGGFAFEDDGPNAEVANVALDTLALDETITGDSAVANFADNFAAIIDYGTDGAGSVAYSLALSADGIGSGLYALDNTDIVDTDGDGIGQGAEITLAQVGNVITGSAGGTDYFTIEIDPVDGDVTFTQINNIWHDDTLDDDEALTLTLEAGDTLSLTQTITDGDNDTDTATLQLGADVFSIDDDGPGATADTAAAAVVAALDESDGTGSGADENDPAVVSAADVAALFNTIDYGTDGAGSVAYGLTATDGVSTGLLLTGQTAADGFITLEVISDTQINGVAGDGTTVAFTIEMASDGEITVTQLQTLEHTTDGANALTDHDDTLSLTGLVSVTQTVTDADGDSATATNNGGLTVTFDDDGPEIDADPNALTPVLTTDDTDIAGPSSGSGFFSGLFDAANFGADGDGGTAYTLSITDTDSGLVDTLSGSDIVLSLNGGVIEGRTNDSDSELVFTIAVDAGTGEVTLTQMRAIEHNDPADPMEEDLSAAVLAGNTVALTATATDGDGDTDSATVDISGNFAFEDDGPDASVDDTAVLDTLVLDETRPEGTETNGDNDPAGLASVMADFADNFTTTIDYGSDGPGSVGYSLALVGTDVASGLFALGTDGNPGASIVLNQSGDVITGSVAGTPYFTITVNPASGEVTFEQLLNVYHDSNPDSDDTSNIMLGADVLTLVQTVTDGDGDMDTADIDLGNGTFSIEDDGPSLSEVTLVSAGGVTTDETDQLGTLVTGTESVLAFVANTGTDDGTTDVSLTINDATTDFTTTQDGHPITLVADVNDNGTIYGQYDDGTGPKDAFTITIGEDGVLSVTQHVALTHPDTNNDDEPINLDGNLSATVTVTDADGDSVTNSVLLDNAITFDDDGPSANHDADCVQVGVNALDVNAAFVIDLSGSINGTEYELMIDALRAAGDEIFANSPDASITLIGFASSASDLGTFTTQAAFDTYIDSIDTAGTGTRPNLGNLTNYEAALDTTMAAFDAVAGENNQIFFLSDGDPTTGGGSGNNPTAAQLALWSTYLNMAGEEINFTGIGIGNNLNLSNLTNLALDADMSAAIEATDFAALLNVLVDAVSISGSTDGNVLTGADTTDLVSGADGFGADGFLSIAWADPNEGSSIDTDGSIDGQYGTLTVDADGNYIYTIDETNPDVIALNSTSTLTDIFTYTVTDGDGDTSTATLDITVKGPDGDVTLSGLDVNGGELSVDEDDLADGTSPNAGDLTQAGSFTIDTPDGVDDVTFGGVLITDAGVFVGGATSIVTAYGTITNITYTGDEFSGTFDFDYVLSDNTLDHGPANDGQNIISDDIAVTVSDIDGDSATGVLNVNVVDDAPIAISPDNSIVENTGNAVVTEELDYFSNIGADQDGTVTFTGINGGAAETNGDQLFASDGTTPVLTAGGDEIYLFGFGTEQLVASTDPLFDINVHDPNSPDASVAFQMTLNPDGTTQANDQYEIEFFQQLDDGSSIDFTGLGFTEAGNPRFQTTNGPDNDLGQSQDLLFSGFDPNGDPESVNTDSSDVSIGNQGAGIDDSEGARIDFVLNADVIGSDIYNHDGHYTVNGFSFDIGQIANGGVTEAVIRIYDDLSGDVSGTPDDHSDALANSGTLDTISEVRVNGVTLDLGGTPDGDGHFISFVSGELVVNGLVLGDTVQVFSTDGYNRIEIENLDDNSGGNNQDGFAIRNFGLDVVSEGSEIDMVFDVAIQDGDGDTADGQIDLTIYPEGGTLPMDGTIKTDASSFDFDAADNDLSSFVSVERSGTLEIAAALGLTAFMDNSQDAEIFPVYDTPEQEFAITDTDFVAANDINPFILDAFEPIETPEFMSMLIEAGGLDIADSSALFMDGADGNFDVLESVQAQEPVQADEYGLQQDGNFELQALELPEGFGDDFGGLFIDDSIDVLLEGTLSEVETVTPEIEALTEASETLPAGEDNAAFIDSGASTDANIEMINIQLHDDAQLLSLTHLTL